MGFSDLMIPSYNTNFGYFYEASKDPPIEAIDRKECGCYRTLEVYDYERPFVMDSETVTSYYLCPEHMKEHLTPVVKQQDEGCKGIVKVNAFRALSESSKVDRFDAGCSVSDCVNTYCYYPAWSIYYSVSPES